ncbi:nuclear transport factor 2 family protein [Kitasatospora aburaviensis]
MGHPGPHRPGRRRPRRGLGLEHIRSTGADGSTAETWSRGTRVFERRDGGWAMVHQHLSFPCPPDAPARGLRASGDGRGRPRRGDDRGAGRATRTGPGADSPGPHVHSGEHARETTRRGAPPRPPPPSSGGNGAEGG